MLRNAAMASSALRRLISSASRRTALRPAITNAIGAIPRRANLQATLSSDNQLFSPLVLSQFRGYARLEDEDDDLSDGEPEFSGAQFDNKYFSEGEEVFDYEYEDDDDDDQLE